MVGSIAHALQGHEVRLVVGDGLQSLPADSSGSRAVAVHDPQRSGDPPVYCVGDAGEVVPGVTRNLTRIPLAVSAGR